MLLEFNNQIKQLKGKITQQHLETYNYLTHICTLYKYFFTIQNTNNQIVDF